MGATLFGSRAAPMERLLRSVGFDVSRIGGSDDDIAEWRRVDEGFTPARVARLAEEFHAGYLILPADRPWPSAPVRREGAAALYRLAPAPAP